jgi:hypothetical protein
LYTVEIQSIDPAGATISKEFNVIIEDQNEAPTAMTLSQQVIDENRGPGTIVGYISVVDPDVNDLHTIKIASRHSARSSFSVMGNSLVLRHSLDFENLPGAGDKLKVELIAEDAAHNRYHHVFEIRCADVNEAASNIFFSGKRKSVKVPENSAPGSAVATLSAEDEDKSDSHIFELIGSAEGRFAIAGNELRVGSAPINYEKQQTHFIRVRATDTGNPPMTYEESLRILVTDVDEAPIVENQWYFSLPETAAEGAIVGIIPAQYDETDVSLSYAIESGNDDNLFRIHSCDGVIFLKDPSKLNRKLAPVHGLEVRVTSILPAYVNVTINVTDVNSPPVVQNAAVTIAENSPTGTVVVDQLNATDDRDASLKYVISEGNIDNTFAINHNSGEIRVARASLNYEALSTYALTIAVSDSEGLTSTCVISIFLQNKNDKPTARLTTLYIRENSPAGTLVGQPLTVMDEDISQTISFSITSGNRNNVFSIDSNGQIIVISNRLNYENIPKYMMKVRAVDSDITDPKAVEFTVIIEVTDSPEPPTFTGVGGKSDSVGVIKILENSPVGTAVGPALKSKATDPDKLDFLTFSLVNIEENTVSSTPISEVFDIDPLSGQLRTKTNLISYEVTKLFRVSVRVTDTHGMFDETTLVINVVDVNDSPTIPDGLRREIEEHAHSNQPIQIPAELGGTSSSDDNYVCANDEDSQTSLSYEIIGGNVNDVFAIVPVIPSGRSLHCAKIVLGNGKKIEL